MASHTNILHFLVSRTCKALFLLSLSVGLCLSAVWLPLALQAGMFTASVLANGHCEDGQNIVPADPMTQFVQSVLCENTDHSDRLTINAFRRRMTRLQKRSSVLASLSDPMTTPYLKAQFAAMMESLSKKAPEQSPYNQRGVYLNAQRTSDHAFLDSTIVTLKENQGSTFVFDVKDGYIYFPNSTGLANEWGMVRPLYDLPQIIEKAKSQGLYTIARYVAIKDEILVKKRPELALKHPLTGNRLGLGWIEPNHESALEYNRQILTEVVKAGVDEVNLDYIRYSTSMPRTLSHLSGSEKADRLMEYLHMVRSVIDTYDPRVQLGISTFAILGWNYEINLEPLGQDVARFAPLVDVISPMAYPETFAEGSYYNPSVHPRSRMYYLVLRTLNGYKEFLGEEHSYKLRPWIQGYYVTEQNMLDQMDAVIDAGGCGFTIWNINGNYGNTYKAMKRLNVPERCSDEALQRDEKASGEVLVLR